MEAGTCPGGPLCKILETIMAGRDVIFDGGDGHGADREGGDVIDDQVAARKISRKSWKR